MMKLCRLLLLAVTLSFKTTTSAFLSPRPTSSNTHLSWSLPHHPITHPFSTPSTTHRTTKSTFLLQGAKIPKEMRDEIYKAEAKTPAAQGRQKRIITYASIAIVSLFLGLVNVALTTMQQYGVDVDAEYGWTKFIPLLRTGWGGYVDIISAGIFGTMVELENRTREETAEKIWDELKRRKEEKTKPKTKASPSNKKSKKNSSKQSKRLAALAEVIVDDDTSVKKEERETATATSATTVSEKETKEEKGMMDKLKGLYEDADKMAAAQALLLNKELEDRGIVEKITDETGLKVVGKDAAKKAKKETKQEKGDSN